MVIVTVTEQHGVDMAIPEAGQYIHPFGRNHFCIGRHLEFAYGPDGGDALVLDDYYAISQGMTAKTVDETTAHQCKRAGLGRCDYETKQKCSSKIKIHTLSYATLSCAFARVLRSRR